MALTEETKELLEEALETLTPKQREVWRLAMEEGLSLSEVAKRLAPSKSAVQHRLNLARKKIIAELERLKEERGANEI